MGNLQEKLEKYYNENYTPMHMPGHKRNIELLGEKLPYKIDITEIFDFDDLHHAEGIIKNIEEKAKKIFGSKKSFLLVNGSTCGILAGIRSVVNFGDKVLVARNCHKSVYNAIEINGLNPIYVLPKIEKNGIDKNISSSDVEKALKENNDIKLVIITSPTYEGVISDIKSIVEVAHKYNIPVLVDEAHGAHLKFIKELSDKEALNSGSDIVIQSLHKTLPALTQTALLHIQGNLVKEEKIAKELAIFETSSPSYILMSSIDECLNILEKSGNDLFEQYERNLKYFYNETKRLEKLKILGNQIENKYENGMYYDFGKIVILTDDTNITGVKLANILREEYKIELEMASINYCIAMTSICDDIENFRKLINALINIDRKLKNTKIKKEECFKLIIPRKERIILDAVEENYCQFVDYQEAEGKVLKEYIWAYPPGIPIIVPGEVIDKSTIDKIKKLEKEKVNLRTTFNRFPKIEICEKKK